MHKVKWKIEEVCLCLLCIYVYVKWRDNAFDVDIIDILKYKRLHYFLYISATWSFQKGNPVCQKYTVTLWKICKSQLFSFLEIFTCDSNWHILCKNLFLRIHAIEKQNCSHGKVWAFISEQPATSSRKEFPTQKLYFAFRMKSVLQCV